MSSIEATEMDEIETLVQRKNELFMRVTMRLMTYISLLFAVIWWLAGSHLGAFICLSGSFLSLVVHIGFRKGYSYSVLRTILRTIVLVIVYTLAASSWHQNPVIGAFFIVVPVSTMLFADRGIATRWLIFVLVAILSLPWVAGMLPRIDLPNATVLNWMMVSLLISVSLVLFFISLLSHNTNQDLISKLNDSHQKLQYTHNALIDSQKAKDRFFASISHEIRTPMNAILGISQILERSFDNHTPIDKDIILDLNRSSSHLVGIVNDLLDFSKMNESKLVLRPGWTQLRKIYNDVIAIVHRIADDKGIAIEVALDPALPDFIFIDEIRFRQIIVNIANNAIKFTNQGGVNISCHKLQSISGHELLQVSIKDSGIGIANSLKSKIFETYEQGDNSAHRHYAGTGLGLAIAKQIIEMQNGRIWFESEENVGTTFNIQLPLIGVNKDVYYHSKIQDQPIHKQILKSILVVDDNALNVKIAVNLLKSIWPDAVIYTANNGLVAIELVKNHQLDVILMDLYMPEMDGFEATQAIRSLSNEIISKTPIIALSANMPESELKKALVAGVNGYLMKPFVIKDLVEIIENNIS